MSVFSPCLVFCPICRAEMDWMRRVGRDCGCCSKRCYDEFDWRRTLAIMGKEYYPDPRPLLRTLDEMARQAKEE